MSQTQYIVKRGTGNCHVMARDWDGVLPDALVRAGWEIGVMGKVRHTAYRCPVNGDGYRYSVQAVCDSTGAVVAEVPYHGPGAVSGEL